MYYFHLTKSFMNRYYYWVFFILMFHISYSQQHDNRKSYSIYNAVQQKEITITDLVESIPPGSILIFGEQHDDSIAHLLESNIFEMLSKKFHNDIVLTMEMLESDIQPIVDEYLSGLISEKNFRKEARTWDNYTDYRPLIEYARQQGIRVIAANAPARYVNLVTRKGLPALQELNRKAKKYIATLPVDTLAGNYYTRFIDAMGGHSFPGMYLYESQNLWDATMAHFIIKAKKKYKPLIVLQLNGRFHSDYHSGLAERLDKSKYRVVTISCFPATTVNQPDGTLLYSIADYIIKTGYH